MSDFTTDPYSDPYGGLDPDTAALIMQLAQGGYQPYPQMMNVPYVKDLMGGSTDPLRQIKSQQSDLKSAKSLMGYDPIAGFAGPEFDPYVPQYDAVAQEVQGDQYGQALLDDLQNGAGALSLQNQIDQATYDPKTDGGPTDGRPLSPQQAKNYKSWLSRAQKAYTADQLEYQKRDQMATQGDPNAVVPTDQASGFNENDWITQLAQRGELGPGRQSMVNRGPVPSATERRVAPQSLLPGGLGGTAGRPSLPVGQLVSPARLLPGALQGKSWVQKAQDKGYAAKEQGYRNDARKAVSQAVQPSAARERAVRAIQAYRLAMGMDAG